MVLNDNPHGTGPKKLAKSRSCAVDLNRKDETSKISSAESSASMPRSFSCSSLTSKRNLFQSREKKTKDERLLISILRNPTYTGLDQKALIEYKAKLAGKRGNRLAGWQARIYQAHKRGSYKVEFDPYVELRLIPPRNELSEKDKLKQWWTREDYGQFRQVLINWKKRNLHKLSPTDNILSVDLDEMDEPEDGEVPENIPLIKNLVSSSEIQFFELVEAEVEDECLERANEAIEKEEGLLRNEDNPIEEIT
eukprot:CAMPEP_0171456370 /NCGR_PEP_ID=MMETSP0945-20130129/2882_1 /TAXON_ID=109269 /ORGANISM="Vaucheria litorea, Strain CCMP2940" /LENGTH=250 /DNA_ID=CAMNT_0011981777 /DNA_START=60 /DNA_END=809 /DNA_ORIENTATION=-